MTEAEREAKKIALRKEHDDMQWRHMEERDRLEAKQKADRDAFRDKWDALRKEMS